MDYTKMDDNQILALGRAGEDEATEFLLQKYGYLVKREVRTVYLIGAETEDLAQEGMIGLFKAIRDYSQLFHLCQCLYPQTDSECNHKLEPQEACAVKFLCIVVYEQRGG